MSTSYLQLHEALNVKRKEQPTIVCFTEVNRSQFITFSSNNSPFQIPGSSTQGWGKVIYLLLDFSCIATSLLQFGFRVAKLE